MAQREPARGVCAIGDPIPPGPLRVLVDTSFIVESMVESNPRHRESRELLALLSERGASIVFSELVDLEVPQAMSYIAALDAGRDRRAGLLDARVRRRSRSLTARTRRRWAEYLASIEWFRADLTAILDEVPAIMFTTGLRSYDAAMAATAIAHRCDAIATFDVDFGRLHEVDVPLLLTDARRAGRMRDLRGAARPI